MYPESSFWLFDSSPVRTCTPSIEGIARTGGDLDPSMSLYKSSIRSFVMYWLTCRPNCAVTTAMKIGLFGAFRLLDGTLTVQGESARQLDTSVVSC